MSDLSIGIVVTVDHLNKTSGATPAVENFIDIFESEVDNIVIIGPNSTTIDREICHLAPVYRKPSPSTLGSILRYVVYQLKVAREIFRHRCQLDLVTFHVGGTLALLPVLTTKVCNIKSLIIVTESPSDSYNAQTANTLINRVITNGMKITEYITCSLADGIILLSDSMASNFPLYGSSNTFTANLNYIPKKDIHRENPFSERQIDMIFVGRFTEEKGVRPLIHSLPSLLESEPQLQVELVGDGRLRNEMQHYIEDRGLESQVNLTGWIDRESVFAYLSDSRFLIIPSYSEGVPKILLEGMACGAIPVATPVGGIGDIVQDGENGFLLSDNNPDSIIQKLCNITDRDDLGEISEKAQTTIKNDYSFHRVKHNYLNILNELIS